MAEVSGNDLLIVTETRQERHERVLQQLSSPVRGTKGMAPKDRAEFLFAELDRRIKLAKEASGYHPQPQTDSAPVLDATTPP